MFAKYLAESFKGEENRRRRFVSLGSGNCELEVELAAGLRSRGHEDFVFECVDLNPAMLERGALYARQAGVSEQVVFVQGDFNAWNPAHKYDAAIANQSLHHVVNLEALFDGIKESLTPDGRFIVSDMIGRNGHQRWPEALEIVHEFWRQLPPSYRVNRVSGFFEELFEDWDCSVESFEGIRSQDILQLLLERFGFHLFIGFGNIMDPFVDRSFGHNFNPDAEWDRCFIDRVHQRDVEEMATGRIKPTHILAVLGKQPVNEPACIAPLTPEFCVRVPGKEEDVPAQSAESPYQWPGIPEFWKHELEFSCTALAEATAEIKKLRTGDGPLQREFEARTEWARKLDRELRECIAWGSGLREELEARTAWAQRVDRELEEHTQWNTQLCEELAAEKRARTMAEAELRGCFRNPVRYAAGLAARIFRKCRKFIRLRSET